MTRSPTARTCCRRSATSRPTTATRTTAPSPRSILPAPGRARARRSRSRSTSSRACRASRCGPATRATSSSSRSGSRRSASSRRTAGTATSSTRTSEFFADFGNYDVSIDVPARVQGQGRRHGPQVDERETSARPGPLPLPARRASTTSPGRPTRATWCWSDIFREAGLGDVAAPPPPAARARGAGRAPLPRGEGRALGLRARPRRLSLPNPDDRRSALGRPRRGRDGVPDADHGGHLLERAAERPVARRA